MKAAPTLLVLAKRKPGAGASSSAPGSPPSPPSSPSAPSARGVDEEAPETPEDAFAREAFGALRDGDEPGFVEAFKGAVRACIAADKRRDYEPTE